MAQESNSSSLNSYKETITIRPIKENIDLKNGKINNNNQFTNFVKNAKDWNNKIKLIDIDKKNKDKKKENNQIKDKLYQILNMSSFKRDNNNIEEEKDNNKFNKEFDIIKNTGEMTPSLRNNSKFFQSKFGKTKIEKNCDKRMRNSFNFTLNNISSEKNYYNVLKEINKLIKHIVNAQEIFLKKTIKIKLSNDEKNLNFGSKQGKNKKRKSITKKSILKNKNKNLKSFQREEENLNESNNFNENELSLEENDEIEFEINIMGLIIEIFKKPSGIRNKDELFFIEHYLMTFENVIKILQQKKLGSAGNDLAKKIARNMQLDIIPKNTVICKLGDNGDKFYVIFQGNVAILIPKETNSKMDINEYLNHLHKLIEIGEYELALKTIESNLHIYKNNDIIYLQADIKKYLYLTEDNNHSNKRENLSISQYMERIESLYSNSNENYNNTNIENNSQSSLLINYNTKSLKEEPESQVNIMKNSNDSNIPGKNVKFANVINKNKIGKKATSLTLNKVLEIKKQVNFNNNIKIMNENNNKNNYINHNHISMNGKIPLKNKKNTTLTLPSLKREEKDFHNSMYKSNKNLYQESLVNHIILEMDEITPKSRRHTFKSVKKFTTQDNNSLNQNNNENNNEENNVNKDSNNEENNKDNNKNINVKNNIILWTYFNVTNLIDGQIFGDVALSESNKRRTATIITQEDTICGTLDNHIYNKFIKDAQKKIRKSKIHSLLNVNFFKGINSDIFEEHYFNMFKHDSIHRNEYLFKIGEERNSIYIIISGEIEISITCTIKKLNKILKIKNVILDNAIKYEERLCELNGYFNHFYNNSVNIYRIIIHSFGCCVGLNEYIIPKEEKQENSENKTLKDIFYVNAKCVSDKAEVYSIDYKLLNNIFKSEKKEKIFEEITENSEKETLLRIIELKKNLILERFRNLCDKNILEYFTNLNNSEEKKENDEKYLENFLGKDNSLGENDKRLKKLNLTINEVDSSLINSINKKKIKEKNISLHKDKISKSILNTIKSNSSSKTSKQFFDEIVNYFEVEKINEKNNIKSKKKLIINNNSVNKIFDHQSFNEDEKSEIYEFNKNTIDDPKNLIHLTNSSQEKNKYNASNKQIKFVKIKEMQFNENNISSKNTSKNNILNKNNKKIILYPILFKKSKSNLKIKFIHNQNKNKHRKKILSKDKLIKQKEDINSHKEEKSIFSLILNGLPNFNNKFINQNLKLSKKCENFKNAKLIDKNLLKLSKGKSFFYKGCESLLTMNNYSNNNCIPVIDLLRYDELYEQKYGIKKRNFSAIIRQEKNLYTL